jgi:hypothetical protein
MAEQLQAFWIDPQLDSLVGEAEEFEGTFSGPPFMAAPIEQGIKGWAWANRTRLLRYHVFEEPSDLWRRYRVKVLAMGTPWLLLVAALVAIGLVLGHWSSRKVSLGLKKAAGAAGETAADFFKELSKGLLPIAVLLIAVLVAYKS